MHQAQLSAESRQALIDMARAEEKLKSLGFNVFTHVALYAPGSDRNGAVHFTTQISTPYEAGDPRLDRAVTGAIRDLCVQWHNMVHVSRLRFVKPFTGAILPGEGSSDTINRAMVETFRGKEVHTYQVARPDPSAEINDGAPLADDVGSEELHRRVLSSMGGFPNVAPGFFVPLRRDNESA